MHAPAHGPPTVPRALLAFAGLAVALSIATAAWYRWSGETLREPDAPVVLERQLRFQDRPDGSVEVLEGPAGRPLGAIEGEAGFARGTLRSLARERRRLGIGDAEPFRLQAHADGRLTLMDPATGQRVDLASFGPDNAAVFARWLGAPTGDAR